MEASGSSAMGAEIEESSFIISEPCLVLGPPRLGPREFKFLPRLCCVFVICDEDALVADLLDFPLFSAFLLVAIESCIEEWEVSVAWLISEPLLGPVWEQRVAWLTPEPLFLVAAGNLKLAWCLADIRSVVEGYCCEVEAKGLSVL